ncbi:MAG: methyltransferase [Pseudomonadota bacterium]|nr:methyltransferase [Pseudomonadota bacterium]
MSEKAAYGLPPSPLADAGVDALQVSPLIPGSADLEALSPNVISRFVVTAPPGTLERRFVLAHALRSLRPGGDLVALAPKAKGGARLRKELEVFGCAVAETARHHHRICVTHRPAAPTGLDEAIAEGGPQFASRLGLWSQPGVFSWDRVDPGSALLLETAPTFIGAGADLGCGVGLLGKAILGSPAVTALTLLDIDRRAVAAARRNIDDPRATFVHADARSTPSEIGDLDFVIMNPPFHDGGREDRGLGHAFIAAAAKMLRKGGVCRLVANVALPYEPALIAHFTKVSLIVQARGYKVHEARR